MTGPWQDTRETAEKRLGLAIAGRQTQWILNRLLGVGGSAWVYVAVAPKTGEEAAIKVLHGPLLAMNEVVTRFVREARLANVIQHPGVVRVLDDGLCDGTLPFFAMELLRGETLEERRERKGGRLPVEEVLWAADQVLAILEVAHAKQIIHRDVKPENVFVTYAREVKLLDFGIARFADRYAHPEEDPAPPSIREVSPIHVDAEAPTRLDSAATRLGTTLGTLDFMPPEQARGDWGKVGVHTDLWAVGATMFTLLSGRTVHDEVTYAKQMSAVANQPATSLRSVAPEVPPAVADLVDFALAFDGPGRWQHARAMRFALWAAYRSWVQGDAPPSSEEGGIPKPPIHFRPDAPPMSTIEIDGD